MTQRIATDPSGRRVLFTVYDDGAIEIAERDSGRWIPVQLCGWTVIDTATGEETES